jgi:hypothetical protein
MNLFPFIPGYDHAIFLTGREPAFVALLSFIVTFMVVRSYTRMARKHGWGSASYNGVHTHHLVFGLILSFLAGALLFGFMPKPGVMLTTLAVMFGCGAALVLDEYALIFHLEDVYWANEGRKSIDAVILGVILGTLFLMRTVPFRAGADVTDLPLSIFIGINLLFVIATALKGKLYTAVFGVFVPGLAIIGAIRLAKPESIWAHSLYKPQSRQSILTEARYRRYQTRLYPLKEWAWNLIGGKADKHPRERKLRHHKAGLK